MYRHSIIAFEAASNQLWLSNIYEQLNFDDGDTAIDTDTDDDGGGDGRENNTSPNNHLIFIEVLQVRTNSIA
jgi:hypothetical protein